LVIISFNYDLIVDIALAHRFRTDFAFDAARLTEQQEPLGIDYGVPFANWVLPEQGRRCWPAG
jgi:hypothetical protein